MKYTMYTQVYNLGAACYPLVKATINHKLYFKIELERKFTVNSRTEFHFSG